jgi:hypothetical protein
MVDMSREPHDADARPDFVTLDLHCPHCGGAVVAEFDAWRTDGLSIEQTFVCPYCTRAWDGAVPARLRWVTRAPPKRVRLDRS